ncbi:MAG: hypothetical protein JXB34_06380 [Bacteroidales bacterium]|nr:hypothetical protein [Bacteroidales bacterium]
MKNPIKILLFVFMLVIACEEGSLDYSSDKGESTGTGGSLARFTITKDCLYTVDNYTLKVFSLSNEKIPEKVNELYAGFEIETIFAKSNLLFLGSRWGVYIYDISEPHNPMHLSTYSHTYSCDPVVVSGSYAYSTLSSSGPCARGQNELDIIDISNPATPNLVKVINMDSPRGLGISGNLLFVCDKGLKVFNIADKENPVFLKKISVTAVDVIPIDTLLLVATESGLSQYLITPENDLEFLSTLY